MKKKALPVRADRAPQPTLESAPTPSATLFPGRAAELSR